MNGDSFLGNPENRPMPKAAKRQYSRDFEKNKVEGSQAPASVRGLTASGLPHRASQKSRTLHRFGSK